MKSNVKLINTSKGAFKETQVEMRAEFTIGT